MVDKFRDLTKAPFSIRDLIHQEALCLSECSPMKNEPKKPSGSKSRLTQMSKFGEGPAHCIVQKWPSNNTPAQWGERNPVLLDDPVPPQIWESLGDEYIAVKRDIVFSRLLDSVMRPKDNGDEEAFRLLIGKLLTRATAAALLFFLNAWSKHTDHSDYRAAIQSLRTFDIKHETKSESSPIPIRNDVNSHIPRNLPLPILKSLEGDSPTVPLLFTNAKSTAHAEHRHSNPIFLTPDFPSVWTVDQVLSALLSIAETQKSSVADLDEFLSDGKDAVWPHIATSHFSQMAYELDMSTSSVGTFSALWGFHRSCFLKYTPEGMKILYVSDNVASETSDEEHRTDVESNKKVVLEFYYLTTLSIIHTFGVRIIPPHLRHEEFLSYFRGE